jgi:hypothetical protein
VTNVCTYDEDNAVYFGLVRVWLAYYRKKKTNIIPPSVLVFLPILVPQDCHTVFSFSHLDIQNPSLSLLARPYSLIIV